MLIALTLVSADADILSAAAKEAMQAVTAAGGRVKEPQTLGPEALDLLLDARSPQSLGEAVAGALAGLPVDFALQPFAGRRKRLLVADMDSTIIGCECLDELADFAGRKAEVAAITERAMRGEIDFEGALRARVAMLAGLPLAALQACFEDRVRLNPGAMTLAATMAANGARTVLVSGGFSYFTERVAAAAGFQHHRANTLLFGEGVLSGSVAEPILGREAKLEALKAEAAVMGLPLAQTLAVGDGANDLLMIEAAGLGVAYRAKPVVAARADARVDHAGLDALLYFQGYRRDAFAPSPVV